MNLKVMGLQNKLHIRKTAKTSGRVGC